ncbi:hypothetical protein SAMN06295912_101372 [Sphingomonas laterariae]|uniref:DUF6265 domain-containing protein n=1 Tax=Edaphosphingomonas laterariae TaxID=861865 RepID=A0A239BRK1_9SPHN|nr:DUF6265 family protein [Sphingomonas laterariae]SNS10637.1 hypothetical protein SAMN06295912_101372 [Sphingomonas laterariae]
MRIGTVMIVAAAMAAASPAGAQDISQFGWLAGAWATEVDGRWAEEWWTPPRGGILIGAGITGKGATADFFEHMRIMADGAGRITFYGSPKGAPAVAFALVRSGAGEAVFENPAHDYPQRVHYRREKEILVVSVSMIDGSKAESWRYKRR